LVVAGMTVTEAVLGAEQVPVVPIQHLLKPIRLLLPAMDQQAQMAAQVDKVQAPVVVEVVLAQQELLLTVLTHINAMVMVEQVAQVGNLL